MGFKILALLGKALSIFGAKVEGDTEARKLKLVLGNKFIMLVGVVFLFLIFINIVFNVDVGEYSYNIFEQVLNYFIS